MPGASDDCAMCSFNLTVSQPRVYIIGFVLCAKRNTESIRLDLCSSVTQFSRYAIKRKHSITIVTRNSPN